MTDIVEFLTARLDEDETAAVRAARPEPWVKPQPPRPNWYVQFWADEQDRAAVVADSESSGYPVVATLGHDGNDEADEEFAEGRVEHIARHDPARVLAEVAAKRVLLEWCAEVTKHFDWSTLNQFGSLLYDPNARATKTATMALCTMAAPYAAHPDYDPAWRVQ